MLPIEEMSGARLKDEVTAARERIHDLEQALGAPEVRSEQVMRLFQEVSTAVEELQVASEEMHVQQLEILETREEVEAQRRRYEELFQLAPDGYLVTDPFGIITEANWAAMELLGISQQHVVPNPLSLFVVEKEKLAFRQRLNRLIEDPAAQRQEWDVPMRTRNGAPFDGLLTVAVVRGKTGQTLSLRWMLRDVTQQKRTEAQLRNLHADLEERVRDRTRELVEVNKRLDEANRQLRGAVTETNHRVKNNLQLITAMLDMQLMDAPDQVSSQEMRRLASQISLVAGVHDLLTKAEEAGGQQTLSARAVLTRMLEMVRRTVTNRTVECCGDEVSLPLKQATSLALVVNELVSNALKHSPGDVQIMVQVEDRRCVVEVLDSGRGFPSDFDARAAAHTGLELVENLVYYDLGGDILYGARDVGGGRVRVTFPLRAHPTS